MPVLDGVEASSQIQNMVNNKCIDPVYIFIVSAHQAEEIFEKIKKIEIIKEFVAKPAKKVKLAKL